MLSVGARIDLTFKGSQAIRRVEGQRTQSRQAVEPLLSRRVSLERRHNSYPSGMAFPDPRTRIPIAGDRHFLPAIDAGTSAPSRLHLIGGNLLPLTGAPLALNLGFHVCTLQRD
jgi:hypothetical protein